MRVDLWCDDCGEPFEDETVVTRYSRRLTWAAARAQGWVEAAPLRHRCPSCVLLPRPLGHLDDLDDLDDLDGFADGGRREVVTP